MGGVELESEPVDLRGKKFDVGLRVLGVDAAGQLRVRMEVRTPAAGSTSDTVDTRATFEVGFFDFPMIDNTRLPNGMRCAVTLGAMSASNADLTTVCFPGEYASLKDRPYYDEVIQQLRDSTEGKSSESRYGGSGSSSP
jgi:hypothetical protein